jgi:hypothetical protein
VGPTSTSFIAVGPPHARHELRDAQRRGIRGEDAALFDDLLEAAKGVALRVGILDDRFENQVAVGEVVQAVSHCEEVERLFARVVGEPPLLDVARERLLDLAARPVDRAGGGLGEHRGDAGLDRHLSDSQAHVSTPENADAADLHARFLLGPA